MAVSCYARQIAYYAISCFSLVSEFNTYIFAAAHNDELRLQGRRKFADCDCPTSAFSLFTARRYASAVYAVVVCPSVRLSIRPSVRYKPVLYQKC